MAKKKKLTKEEKRAVTVITILLMMNFCNRGLCTYIRKHFFQTTRLN
jgi:hypothetical protein